MISKSNIIAKSIGGGRKCTCTKSTLKGIGMKHGMGAHLWCRHLWQNYNNK